MVKKKTPTEGNPDACTMGQERRGRRRGKESGPGKTRGKRVPDVYIEWEGSADHQNESKGSEIDHLHLTKEEQYQKEEIT